MAKFSEQFIQGLLAPNPMTVGMMELGKKVGGLGPQMKANRLKKEREEALSGFDPSTPQGLVGLATF